MFEVELIIHGELNDFLRTKGDKHSLRIKNCSRRSLKDLIESIGIPHPEIGRVLVNNFPVDLSFVVNSVSQIQVFPCRIQEVQAEWPWNSGEIRFVCDVHLGRLTRYLRLLGFDVSYGQWWSDRQITINSEVENRIILTRDRHLLMRSRVKMGHCIRSSQPDQQVKEVMKRFQLRKYCRPFSRCLVCNGILIPIPPEDLITDSENDIIPFNVRQWCQAYSRCDSCRKIYWKGSHYQKMQAKLNEFLA